MRQLLDLEKGHSIALAIAALFGMTQFARFFSMEPETLIRYGILSGLVGVAGLFLFSWLIRNFGRFFGADARQREVRTALGLGMLPWTILFAGLSLVLVSGLSPESVATQYGPIALVVLIYGFYTILLSLTAALHLSLIKTFLCLVVTILFGFFPLAILAQQLISYLI